ncbi:hypothetical protein ThrDRAFT_01146 [Frankia casuarinae]|nr:hypothetical protein CcI6DRAFT_01115 [Frankia sp. CcI6]EYT93176.1 hypothetical protein ThrDRAFT_01146 [Frankia casuarinae]KDA42705.1 hypothetical protein BMG523Draft_02405 [Frankia sp. BMG5.23]KFB04141.1 hypothetical protein ALLO2DRAFT_03055 [Frankia sp. Allo2]OAA26709.1 hypothetical protein AAY23_102815 [Frankia casuarinae]
MSDLAGPIRVVAVSPPDEWEKLSMWQMNGTFSVGNWSPAAPIR